MMERSRSRLDPIMSLRVADRELAKSLETLGNRDHSLPDWIAMNPLSGAWLNFGGSEPTAAYWRDSAGIVRLRGMVKTGVIPSALFTLPALFRPGSIRRFPVVSAGAFGYVSVTTAGVITIEAGSNVSVDLSAISFRAEI